MTDFYLKKQVLPVSGPFTGIELREAALAGVILPQDGVAASPRGPWMAAAQVGLFSETHQPLPHPAGTIVPEFYLLVASEVSQGPMKLRALIDLAVRNRLPPNASIQPVGRLDRIPANQFGILGVCVRGELSQHQESVTPPPRSVAPLRSNDWSSAHTDRRRTTRSPLEKTDRDDVGETQAQDDSTLADNRNHVLVNIRQKKARLGRQKIRIAGVGASVILVLTAGVVAWITRPSVARVDRSEVIGSWVSIPSHKAGKAFGISFGDDGSCVVFNSDGHCWTGDFSWSHAASRPADSQNRPSSDADVDGIAEHHHRFPVREGDGYLRLNGGITGAEPMLRGQPIRECFVRRDGEFLWIGYNAHVDLATQEESLAQEELLYASWTTLWPRRRVTESVQLDRNLRGTDLLSRYSVPDEARLLNSSEIDANRIAEASEPRSLVRYNALRLALFADGSVRRYNDPKPPKLMQ